MKTIGVIGLGSIGMRHAKNLHAMGYKVRGYDPILERRCEVDGVLWEIDEIMQTCKAVVIASPTPEHHKHLSKAIDYGLDILVEKPIMDSLRLSDAEVSRFDKACNGMVGYNLRFLKVVQKAKNWLDNGVIGDPIWANFTLGQHSEKPPYLRDGVILNWSHEIDLALYLLGDAKVAASSTLLRDGKDTMTDILLTHKGGGCRTTVHLDYNTDPEQRYFSITGAHGSIKVDIVSRCAELRSFDTTEKCMMPEDWNDTYTKEMIAFLNLCDGKMVSNYHGCSGAEALNVLKICLEVRKQAGLG